MREKAKDETHDQKGTQEAKGELVSKPSTIIVCISDTHTGSTVGLAPSKFTLHTGRKHETQTATYNECQNWLLACWVDLWQFAKEKAGIRGKHRRNRLIVFCLGDLIDGDHHGSTQIMDEIEDQKEAFYTLFRPVVAMADKVYVTYGTDAHNGGAGKFEIEICNELGNTVRHDWYHSLDIDGVTFDLGHHGRAGTRDWSSSAAGYAVDVALDYFKMGMKPPQYILRGDRHRVDDSGRKVEYSRAITLPCWQLRSSFGHKVSSGKRWSDIGGIIIDTALPQYVDFERARYMAPEGERVYEKV
jgi:hypothetical protein